MQQVSTILLIDDDPLVNFINEAIIREVGFAGDIRAFENPLTALAVLKELAVADCATFPEVIFLDINMPVTDGWDFLDEYEKLPQAALTRCRVYILTTIVNNSEGERYKAYKTVTGFFTKPLRTKTIFGIFGLTVISQV